MPTPSSGSDSSSYFNLDASQAAKQMAALNVSHARMAANARGPSGGSGGTSSGPYPSGINTYPSGINNPVNYPPGNHDILAASANVNFQFPNNHGTSSTPSSTVNPPFLDPAMSHSTPARNHNQGTSLKQRQQSFLQGLHSIMAKRNTPLPPSLTGIPSANYDPSTSPWSMIEPSGEVGSFRLAGKDIDLFKLWGLVFQNGGGHSVRPLIATSIPLPLMITSTAR
jgi:SWI/SNF chromatin-remodeling complex subunit SWI1